MDPLGTLVQFIQQNPQLALGLVIVLSTIVILTELRFVTQGLRPIGRYSAFANTLASMVGVYAVSVSITFVTLALETIFLSMILVAFIYFADRRIPPPWHFKSRALLTFERHKLGELAMRD